jgi:carbon storage regulator
MLILARRPGERVVIGDEILVTVMAVNGHTVRLGIEAPRGVSVYREEIWLAVKEENRAAAEADADALPATPVMPGERALDPSPEQAEQVEQPEEGSTA